MAKLRSDFTPGSTRWAVRRAQWSALGLKPSDYEGKPIIAVVNSSSELGICFSHLDAVAKEVSAAVKEAGGVPFEIRTTATNDFITSAGKKARYILSGRDLMVNDIEAVVEGAQFDGMICLSSCDKTAPAHMMAAVRLNIPTMLVIGGYQEGNTYGGCEVDIDTVYDSVGAVVSGKMTTEDLGNMACCAIRGPGVCAGLGTANTMHMMAEALGMTLPGSAPIRANSERMHERARACGARIVGMVQEQLTPRKIITKDAISNAIEVALAIGGSVNCVRHLTAIANEADLDIDVISMFERQSAGATLLARVRPNGSHTTHDLEMAGGTRAVLKALESRLNVNVLTVTGKALKECLTLAPEPDGTVIHTLEDPCQREAGLLIFRGTLAPDGCIVKSAGLDTVRRKFSGPARVYDTEDGAIEALGRGEIQANDVVVLRGMGPRGGPGTVFACSFAAALNGAQLGGEVAVVTDGELSGLNHGLIVGQVMPEAADGGPLAGVRDGDQIAIDIDARTVNVEPVRDGSPVTSGDGEVERGWLGQYRELVGPIQEGAVLLRRKRT